MPRIRPHGLLSLVAALALVAPAAGQGLPDSLARRVEEHRRFRADAERANVDAALDYFEPLAEWLLTLRAETVHYASRIAASASADRPVAGRDLEKLRLGTLDHVAARTATLELIAPYRGWHVDGHDTLSLPPDARRRGVLLAAAGAALLYDNFELAVGLFARDGRMRTILNRADLGFELGADQLLEAMRLYYSSEQREEMRAALFWLERRQRIGTLADRIDPREAWLEALIAESPATRRIASGNAFSDVRAILAALPEHWSDLLDGLAREATQQTVSSLLGGGEGQPTPRLGHLNPTPALLASLAADMRPLDILLDKSRWRGAIDVAIPGYFTHVAIWLGDRGDLQRAGLWDHPLVVPHHADFETGPVVLEAVRSGVKLTPLPAFLNLDELVVLRRRSAGEPESGELLRALRQVGKAYDFNFEVETTDRLVCSELPYLVYTDLDWQTGRLAGRAVISPDNVARAALDGGPLRVVRVLVGNQALGGDLEAALRRLLESEGSGAR